MLIQPSSSATANCRHLYLLDAKPPLHWTNEELESAIQAVMDRYFPANGTSTAQGYLPGLTPEWNLRTVSELGGDLPKEDSQLGATRFGNYLGNFAQNVDPAREIVKMRRRNQEKYIREYYSVWMETEQLREFWRRHR